MKKLLIGLGLLLTAAAYAADIKISQLPLGSASSTTSSDSFPFVSASTNTTKRLTLWDISNTPTIVSTYVTKANPTFTGTLTTPALIVSGQNANTVPYLNASKALTSSAVTQTELGRLSGVTASLCGISQSCVLTNKTISGASNTLSNIGYSSLSLTGSIVNTDISSSAAIAYSKLSLANSLLNADVNSAAAIAYSKLNLAGSILGSDISVSAAIPYSKLNLSTSIVNADVNSAAAIAYSKLSLASSIVNADVASGAAVALNKLAATTASRALVSDGSGFVSPSAVTSTELGYVSGVTSALQTQIDSKDSITSVSARFNTSTGHNHDGSNSKKVLGTNIDSTGATANYVLTANGSGASTWAAASGGSSTHFSASLTSGSQTSNGGVQTITAWVSTYDTASGFNAGTGEYTIPTTGYYLIHGAVTFATGTGQGGAFVFKNGTLTFAGGISPLTSASSAHTFSGTLSLTAGDVIKVAAYQNSGGSLSFNSGNPGIFSIDKW